MNIEKELDYLKDAIVYQRLDKSWRDGLFVDTEEKAESRFRQKYDEAEASYLRMMRSPKNDGSQEYREWAIKAALGLKKDKHRVN